MKNKRNGLVQAMIKRHKVTNPHKDRRTKRSNNPKRSWKEDIR
jgi:hypothetical protein